LCGAPEQESNEARAAALEPEEERIPSLSPTEFGK